MSSIVPRFHAYEVGDEYASACTNLTDTMAVATLNLEHPDAIGPWRIADQPFNSSAGPVPNGTACPDGLAGYRHVLFVRP